MSLCAGGLCTDGCCCRRRFGVLCCCGRLRVERQVCFSDLCCLVRGKCESKITDDLVQVGLRGLSAVRRRCRRLRWGVAVGGVVEQRFSKACKYTVHVNKKLSKERPEISDSSQIACLLVFQATAAGVLSRVTSARFSRHGTGGERGENIAVYHRWEGKENGKRVSRTSMVERLEQTTSVCRVSRSSWAGS